MRSDPTYDRVRCAVSDLGLDPTGADPVDDALEAATETGTRIEFPPGEYLLTRPHTLADVERHAWVGTGEDREAVRLLVAGDALPTPLTVTGGRDLLFDGFTFVTERSRPVEWAMDVDGSVSVADVGVTDRGDETTHDEPSPDRYRRGGIKTLSVVGRGAVASYEVTVSGRICPDASGPSHTPAANVSGPMAEGALRDEIDQYRFTGEVTAFSLTGPADVRVDGRPISPTRLPATDGDVVRVESRHGDPVDYRLDADAPVGQVGGGAVAADHTVEGRTRAADGWVTAGHFDHFETVAGSARLFQERVLVSPAALSAPRNDFLVAGDVDYTLRTEGRLHEDADPTLGGGTRVSEAAGGTDESVHHRFDGGVSRLTLEGEGAATLAFE
jgi:hypothetical protein